MKRILRKTALVLLLCFLLCPAQANAVAQTLPVAQVWDTDLCCVIGVLPQGAELSVLEAEEEYLRIDCYELEGMLPVCLTEKRDGKYYVNQLAEDAAAFPLLNWDTALQLRSQITATALAQLGMPYVYGGTGGNGFDCSGFVQYVYRENGIPLSRVVMTQLAEGLILPAEDLLPGDLVVFENTYDTGPSHIGIYLGQGNFIHASSSRGITVSNLEEEYYAEHFLCGRRVLPARLCPDPMALPLISAAAVKNSAGR